MIILYKSNHHPKEGLKDEVVLVGYPDRAHFGCDHRWCNLAVGILVKCVLSFDKVLPA
jgi:hypothetical protein